jgi:signal transduction histidine kinase
MGGLVNDVLDMARSRVGSGILLTLAPLNLGELVQRLVAEHHHDATIQVELSGNLDGHWDPGRLAQAISNLLGNAVQHGAAHGAIEVVVNGEDAQDLRLSISNAGGIPPSVRGRLFDPFRGREARGSENGLGLGLYIVKQIALAHGGNVSLAPDEERTTFTLELPRKTATPHPPRVSV